VNDDALRGYYAGRAPEYDRVYLKPERQADLRAIEAWLPERFAGKSTLELACGTGHWTRRIAPVASEVLAIDVSTEVLDIARARLAPGAARFVRGDAYRLPVAAGRFEAAFAGFWYSHVPLGRVRAFLDELHRALAPGATVVLLDNRFVPGSSTPLAERDSEGNTWQLRRLADGSTHSVLKNFPSGEELREAVSGIATGVHHARMGVLLGPGVPRPGALTPARSHARMQRYRNLSGNSGVVAYELTESGIVVKFVDGWKYEYTCRSAGADTVATMRRLADSGRGLAGFISRHAREAYARKFR
jgi:ubiquinone/menaquinone biosynthesis C-methylase UbiE